MAARCSLPVDERARCATVCRGRRALLADARLWTRLDLSPGSGAAAATEQMPGIASAAAAAP
jgi:hypothetical protein